MAETTNELRRVSGRHEPSLPPVISEEPGIIQAQIERTRAQMSHTIDEIQTRLSPENLKQQTQEIIREATIGKVEKMVNQAENTVDNWRTSAVKTMKANPIPVALIGIGVGWLLLKDDDTPEHNYYSQRFDQPSGGSYSYMPSGRRSTVYNEQGFPQEARERVAETARQAKEWVGDKVEAVQEKAEEVTNQVQRKRDETWENLEERTEEITENVRETAHEIRDQARQQMYRARHTFWHTLNENPLTLGAAALAVGAVVGLALPGTAKEDELMGEARDHLVQEAKQTAQQTAQKVQAVAEQAQHAAVEEGRREAEKQELLSPEQEDGSSEEEQTTVTSFSSL